MPQSTRSTSNASTRTNAPPLMDPLLPPPSSPPPPLLSEENGSTGRQPQQQQRQRRHDSSSSYDYFHWRNGSTAEPTSSSNSCCRILDRDADFFQSRGRWSGVQLLPRQPGRRNRSSLTRSGEYHYSQRPWRQRQAQCCCFLGRCYCGHYCSWLAWKRRCRRYWPALLWDDWFHTLAYQRTIILMAVLFVAYTAIVMAFGAVYFTVSILGATHTKQSDGSYITNSFCGMDINDHMEALYFSMSTMATIGYGVSDYYFGGCWTPFLLVLGQVCTAITFDACAVGLLFTRLSRGRKRSKTIVVSNQAVVQRVRGQLYFMVRVGELRRYPLIDASVKFFCIRHERIPRPLLMPTQPPPLQSSGYVDLATASASASASADVASVATVHTAKASNQTNNSTTTRTRIPIETTYFVTKSMTLLYPDEILMSLPQVIVHKMEDPSPLLPPSTWYDAQGRHHVFPDSHMDVQAQIQEFWNDRGMEIVVLVQGTDELTGAAIQTRHSYCCTTATGGGGGRTGNNHPNNDDDHSVDDDHAEGDVVWNRTLANCILPTMYDDDNDDSHNARIVDEEVGYSSFRTRQQQQQQSRRRHRQGSRQHYPVCTVDFSRFHDTVPTLRDCVASPYVP